MTSCKGTWTHQNYVGGLIGDRYLVVEVVGLVGIALCLGSGLVLMCTVVSVRITTVDYVKRPVGQITGTLRNRPAR